MNEITKRKLTLTFLAIIILTFVVLLIINETNLFNKQQTHSFEDAANRQVSKGTLNVKEKDGRFVNASKSEVKKAMTVNSDEDNLNHMDVSEKVSISESELNDILKDKGILKNKAKTFLKAQDKYEVNVIYLVSHALVETGNGKSQLAQGLKNGKKKYYNFYGIGAFDKNAVKTGSSYAKKQQWDSPEKAIMGGAKFVRKHYFDNYQLSLYQMRWNPKSPGKHQYASDINWDRRIAHFLKLYYFFRKL